MTQQKVFFEDDKLVIKSRHDVNPILDRVRQLRDQNIDGFGENKLVGSIHMPLLPLGSRKLACCGTTRRPSGI